MKRLFATFATLLLAAYCSPRYSTAAEATDFQTLVNGVERIASPGVPGNICVFGPGAMAIVADGNRNVIVAAAHYGRGRVVLWSHNGYFDKKALETADTGKLFDHAVRWVAGSKRRPRIGFVGRGDGLNWLKARGFDCRRIALGDFESVDVVIGPIERAAPAVLERLDRWVQQGGGIVSGATGWGWQQLHRNKKLSTDFAANRLFAPMGLVFAAGTARDTAPEGFRVSKTFDPLLNAAAALEAAEAHQTGRQPLTAAQLTTISNVLSLAMRSVPPDDQLLRPKLNRVLASQSLNANPTPRHPLTTKDVLARLVLTQQVRQLQQLPPERVTAHPSAAAFPGHSPPGTQTVPRTVQIDTATPGWHSTGLYADPGALIRIELPPTATKGKLKVRIGSTTCRLWKKDRWLRCPEVTREFGLRQTTTAAASAFGGLIYIVVPDSCRQGVVPVKITGGVPAPYFVLGETDVSQWRSRIRMLPAPWAELESEKAILTVPSGVIRRLDDPAALMQTWNRILDAAADLAQRPRQRRRPQRYVADIQLCAGYMHAGNPIMVPVSTAARLVDRQHLLEQGDWGFFHETGHMHQHRDWTFAGTGEVTVNLFTMYIFDKVCGIPPEKGRMAQQRVRRQYLDYFRGGRSFETWKQKPFLALYMYYQLQQAFGWDAFKKVFAEYRDLPDSERPKTDDQKRDQWLVRMSRTVGRNLGPFFEAWAVPTSAAARASIRNLPVWMPTDFPPRADR